MGGGGGGSEDGEPFRYHVSTKKVVTVLAELLFTGGLHRKNTGYSFSKSLYFSRVSLCIFQDISDYRFLPHPSHHTLHLSPIHLTLRQLIAGLSPWRLQFDPRLFHVGFV